LADLEIKADSDNDYENLAKSADPNNKGIVSFAKFVLLVEINKNNEEIDIADPEGITTTYCFFVILDFVILDIITLYFVTVDIVN